MEMHLGLLLADIEVCHRFNFPEDVYDGTQGQATTGHPWFITTLAIARLYFEAAEEFTRAGSITITQLSAPFFQFVGVSGRTATAGATYARGSAEFKEIEHALITSAENTMRRVQFHVGPSGLMAEQFNRDSGFQLSAANLTWSYFALVTTQRYRVLSDNIGA